ncbi:CPBP family glutamic-type intramembrane protease [Nocardiopsis exhalans]|uniref:CPBP family glutamic-type intramembrane protease n=1 Tax=Nocardiopsis exhalans TaxID=163604 RepID=A0ABY5CZJ5_9ACTN|nr:CPBP family glutamic-type intramembrane protease [Nocardiopsis exhalans]USY17341.1 CPBP family glutamic-type intramembrane protease [Nocardiopsis exhalans]
MPQPEPFRRRGAPARIGLLVLAFTLAGAGTLALVNALPVDTDHPLGRAVRSGTLLLVVLPLVWLLCRSAGTTLSVIGLATPGRAWPPLVAATLTCLVVPALIVAAALLVGDAALDASFTPSLLGTAVLTALLLALLLSPQILAEELVFRGYVQHLLGFRLSQLTVVLAQAVLYAGSMSLVLGEVGELFNLVLAGVFFGLLRMTTGGIWAGTGARLALAATAVMLDRVEFTFGSPAWELVLNIGTGVATYLVIRYLFAARPELVQAPDRQQEALPRQRLSVRGIMYDVGSSYMPGQNSRERWNPEAVREDMRVIREDLHCTTVSLFGHDLNRLEQGARFALEQGLDVWLQPRAVDARHPELIEHVGGAAEAAERLISDHPGRIVLNVGCELTVLNRGILPGRDMGRRAGALYVFAMFPVYHNLRLNRLLRRLAATARERFSGPLSYGAGTWEEVDWSPFDIVGVDYYFDDITRSSYRQGLRALTRWNKPVVVTEFGCCSYRGAEAKGGSGADPMDWSDLDDRRVRGDLVRDERVQADMIEWSIDVYETEDVHGAFLCMFVEGDCHYSPDPTRDLDMAGFGIVRPPTLESGLSADDGHWEPKEGFHALARRYGSEVGSADGAGRA